MSEYLVNGIIGSSSRPQDLATAGKLQVLHCGKSFIAAKRLEVRDVAPAFERHRAQGDRRLRGGSVGDTELRQAQQLSSIFEHLRHHARRHVVGRNTSARPPIFAIFLSLIGKEAAMAKWLKCTARRGGEAIHVSLENAVSVYWSERDKATVIAFIGGEKDAVLVEEKPEQILGGQSTPFVVSSLIKRRPAQR
jgi:hypothetical protein